MRVHGVTVQEVEVGLDFGVYVSTDPFGTGNQGLDGSGEGLWEKFGKGMVSTV